MRASDVVAMSCSDPGCFCAGMAEFNALLWPRCISY